MNKKNFYIDFYKKNKISPVQNKILKKYFFNQRDSLYSHLSLDFNHINQKDIIEFGPGNGINSIHTFSYNPKFYNFVDANPTGIKNLKENLEKYLPQNKNYKITKSYIEKFKIKKKFDLVICEGLLPNSLNPEKLTRYCGSFTKKNGIYIITCHDHISTLSETMRCLLSTLVTRGIKDLDMQVSKLSNFFEKDFDYLQNMTRSKKDWVLDNFINTEFWQDAKLFSIAESISTLKNDFVFKSSSPKFIQDWNWYKNIKSNNVKYFNDLAISSFKRNQLNFLDVRVVSGFYDLKKIEKINSIAKRIRISVKTTANDISYLPVLINECQNLSKYLNSDFDLTKKSIDSYVNFLKEYKKYQKINQSLLKNFRKWWGRGMQYVSFQKI